MGSPNVWALAGIAGGAAVLYYALKGETLRRLGLGGDDSGGGGGDLGDVGFPENAVSPFTTPFFQTSTDPRFTSRSGQLDTSKELKDTIQESDSNPAGAGEGLIQNPNTGELIGASDYAPYGFGDALRDALLFAGVSAGVGIVGKGAGAVYRGVRNRLAGRQAPERVRIPEQVKKPSSRLQDNPGTTRPQTADRVQTAERVRATNTARNQARAKTITETVNPRSPNPEKLPAAQPRTKPGIRTRGVGRAAKAVGILAAADIAVQLAAGESPKDILKGATVDVAKDVRARGLPAIIETVYGATVGTFARIARGTIAGAGVLVDRKPFKETYEQLGQDKFFQVLERGAERFTRDQSTQKQRNAAANNMIDARRLTQSPANPTTNALPIASTRKSQPNPFQVTISTDYVSAFNNLVAGRAPTVVRLPPPGQQGRASIGVVGGKVVQTLQVSPTQAVSVPVQPQGPLLQASSSEAGTLSAQSAGVKSVVVDQPGEPGRHGGGQQAGGGVRASSLSGSVSAGPVSTSASRRASTRSRSRGRR